MAERIRSFDWSRTPIGPSDWWSAALRTTVGLMIANRFPMLEVDCPPMPEPAYVDREMSEKIVLNLVSNAFKFTFEGGIEVRLRNDGAHFKLTVRDTGAGIPADELPKVFERFHRVADARGRAHEGSGIGFALVQDLVRLHGGTVEAESVYSEGATFRVRIPIGKNHLPQAEVGAAATRASTTIGAQPFIDEGLLWLPDGSESEHVAWDAPTGEQAGRPRLLLVDDNTDMRDYLRRLLGGCHEVQAAETAKPRLRRSRSGRPISS